MDAVGILGTGAYRPKASHATSSLLQGASHTRVKPINLERATGVIYRRYVSDDHGEDTVSTASPPPVALDDARVSPASIDLVLSACAVPYQPIPATAPLSQRELGLADHGNQVAASLPMALDHTRRNWDHQEGGPRAHDRNIRRHLARRLDHGGMMRIAVTGATGFLGRVVCRQTREVGHA